MSINAADAMEDLDLDALTEEEDDRRRAERLPLHAEVSVESETNFFTGLTENLSEGGLFVATFSPPPVGGQVKLRVKTDLSEEVEVEGIVRWHRKDAEGSVTGCGIQFVALAGPVARAFAGVMSRLRKEPLLYEV
jgi:uncharacterized protein (TIGR02266 family)